VIAEFWIRCGGPRPPPESQGTNLTSGERRERAASALVLRTLDTLQSEEGDEGCGGVQLLSSDPNAVER
jgi:hypothetical protein